MARQSPKQYEEQVTATLNDLIAPRARFVAVAVTGTLAVARGVYSVLTALVDEMGLAIAARDAQVEAQQRKAQAAKAVASKARVKALRARRVQKAAQKAKTARRKARAAAPTSTPVPTPETPAETAAPVSKPRVRKQ